MNKVFDNFLLDRLESVMLGIRIGGIYCNGPIVRGDRDSRANLMPIYGDLYQIKL